MTTTSFTISRNSLLTAMQHAKNIIRPRHDKPYYQRCFHFSFSDNGDSLTIQAACGDISFSKTVTLDDIAVNPRPFSLYYYDIIRAVKTLEEQPLQFQLGEYQLKVCHASGAFCLPTANCNGEFRASIQSFTSALPDDAVQLEYEAPGLRSVIARASFAMANDELRPALCGLLVNITADGTDYVSSNGHILVRVSKKDVPDCFDKDNDDNSKLSFIIPSDVVRFLLRVLPFTGNTMLAYWPAIKEEQGSLTYVKRPAAARLVINDTITVSFRTTDGRYPNYAAAFPKHPEYIMTVDRIQLIRALTRTAIFAPDSGLASLHIPTPEVQYVAMPSQLKKVQYVAMPSQLTQKLRITAEDTDYESQSEESVPCIVTAADGAQRPSAKDPATLDIGIKAVTLNAIARKISSELVCLSVTDPSRAVIIQPQQQPDNEEITVLLMPMLVNN